MDDERFVEEQEEAAAAEAGAIGGRGSQEDVPPEERAVREGGGGEAEGFEQAEELLQEHASHGDDGPDPSHLQGEPERDIGQQEGTYADTDDVEASERNIPDEGHDHRGE
jgi:hypothetical protein